MIGSNRTTNEENYLLQKFARKVLGTNNIDHHRTADYAAFARALRTEGPHGCAAGDWRAPAILLIGNDPTEQHPLLAWNLRTNLRHNNARIYVVNHRGIKLVRQAHASLMIPQDGYARRCASWAARTSLSWRSWATKRRSSARRSREEPAC